MLFSTTELEIISQKGKGKITAREIALAMQKSESQIYRSLEMLEKKQIITMRRGSFEFNANTHINLLVNILIEHPNLCNLLSDSAITVLQECLEPTKVSEIVQRTKLHKTTIHKLIKKFQKASIILKSNTRYSLNTKLWADLIEFIKESKKFNENLDTRVSPHVKIYHKDKETILFSSKKDEDAQLTAFSVYQKYGIPVLNTQNYYSLPLQKQTVMDIMVHSLQILEKKNDFRNILFATLFYIKNKDKLRNIDHPILENIKKTIKGETVQGYPTLADIANRAKSYNIEVKR